MYNWHNESGLEIDLSEINDRLLDKIDESIEEISYANAEEFAEGFNSCSFLREGASRIKNNWPTKSVKEALDAYSKEI